MYSSREPPLSRLEELQRQASYRRVFEPGLKSPVVPAALFTCRKFYFTGSLQALHDPAYCMQLLYVIRAGDGGSLSLIRFV